LLGYAFFAQYVQGVEPCPLCMFQRAVVVALLVIFVAAAAHNPDKTGARVYAVLVAVVTLTGIGLALRHIYIQSQPPGTVESCGAPLETLFAWFSVTEVVRKVLTGSGECGEVTWKFLGLTMPMWLLGWFVLLGGLGFWRNWRRVPPPPPVLATH
jgi:disulfide bond formation protein DsbB